MKKKLCAALAVTGFISSNQVFAEVTVFGVADAAFRTVSGDGTKRTNDVISGGNLASRIGFRGSEKLDNGLKVSFWLEAGFDIASGRGEATSTDNRSLTKASGLAFNRRSTLSVEGGFGELRIGRDLVPSYRNHSVFDPFGNRGVAYGNGVTLALASASAVRTNVRASNSIAYHLPKMENGIYGTVMYANAGLTSGEHQSDGTYIGARLGYKKDRLDVAAGYGKSTMKAAPQVRGYYNNINAGASWNFDFMKLSVLWSREKITLNARKNSSLLVGVKVPVGSGEIRASYIHSKVTDNKTLDAAANRFGLGYLHKLSKRTSVYTTYARTFNNKGAEAYFSNGQKATAIGGNTSGFNMGITHIF